MKIKKLFEGRLGRWHYFFGKVLISLIGAIAVRIIFAETFSNMMPYEKIPFEIIFAFALFDFLAIPLIIRRLHDIDQPGYLAFLSFLSYFGGIFFLITIGFNLFIFFKKGNKEQNQFGNSPENSKKFLDAILNK